MKKSGSVESDREMLEKLKKKRRAHGARALKEAAQRKEQIDTATRLSASREKNGRGGLDPARFGDWEVKGITSDF